MITQTKPPVPRARGGEIDDRTLAQLRRLGHDAASGLATEAEEEWLKSCSGPLLDELARWRAFGARLEVFAAPDNVIILPAVR